jgi:hypothetical protein
MSAKKLTAAQVNTNNRIDAKTALTNTQKLVLAGFGGAENKLIAKSAKHAEFAALLKGDQQDKPQAARTVLRAFLKLEHVMFNDAFSDWTGSLNDVANMDQLATPHAWAYSRGERAVEAFGAEHKYQAAADAEKASAALKKVVDDTEKAAKFAATVAAKIEELRPFITAAQDALTKRVEKTLATALGDVVA